MILNFILVEESKVNSADRYVNRRNPSVKIKSKESKEVTFGRFHIIFNPTHNKSKINYSNRF